MVGIMWLVSAFGHLAMVLKYAKMRLMTIEPGFELGLELFNKASIYSGIGECRLVMYKT